MKVSASIELVWQLAGQEAIAGKFKEIEPEHFCMALLKFSELPVEEVDKIAPGAEVAKELAADVTAVREELDARSVDTPRARRELRKQVGKGDSPNDGGQMHRSKASRELIDAAAALADEAGSETLAPCHVLAAILASPSEAMAAALGDGDEAGASKMAKLPHLAQHGRDLVQMARDGKLLPAKGRQAEGRALVRALAESDKKGILLVTNDDATAMQAADEAAAAIASKQCPASLKRHRIVDVTSIESLSGERAGEGGNAFEGVVEKLVAEAASVEGLVLVWPAIQAERGAKGISCWGQLLRTTLAGGEVRCICRIAQLAYHKWVEQDSAWRRLVHVMWIRDEARGDIPDEL